MLRDSAETQLCRRQYHLVFRVAALFTVMLIPLVPVSWLCHAIVMLLVAQRAAASASPVAEAAAAAAPAPAECSVDLSSGAIELPSVMCYSSAAAPEGGTQGIIVASRRRLRPPTLLQVLLLSPVGKSGGGELCGLDATGRSDRMSENVVWAQARSTSNATLEVRRGIDRRWLLTSSFIDSAWYTMMAWTNASLRVLFDPSCSTGSDQRFVQEYIPAWSICQRFANGSSVQFERWNGSTLFAQDRRLAPWVTLPSDYECSDGKDYKLLVSAAGASTKVTVTLYTRPGDGSCRMLCIDERCDETFLSDHSVGGNQSLSIRYKIRSPAANCDSEAYTGFALVLQVNPSSVITLTTYEMDSPFNALEVSSTNVSLLIIACVTGAVALIIIVTVSIVIARWCNSRRLRRELVAYPDSTATLSDNQMQNSSHIAAAKSDSSRGAYSYAAQGNRLQANVSRTASGQESQCLNAYEYVSDHNRTPNATANSAQLPYLSREVALNDLGPSDIYAEIDDLALSTDVPRTANVSCRKAQGDNTHRFLGNSSLADSKSVVQSASKLASNTYAALDGRTDVHAYSVPASKLTSNQYSTLDGPLDVNAYSVPTK